MIIIKEDYPKLFYCFHMICMDNGIRFHDRYKISDRYNEDTIFLYNHQLKQLSEDELNTLSIGEYSEMLEIISDYQIFSTNALLNDFFDNYCIQGINNVSYS